MFPIVSHFQMTANLAFFAQIHVYISDLVQARTDCSPLYYFHILKATLAFM